MKSGKFPQAPLGRGLFRLVDTKKMLDGVLCTQGYFFVVIMISTLLQNTTYPLLGYNGAEIVKNEVRVGLLSPMTLFRFD